MINANDFTDYNSLVASKWDQSDLTTIRSVFDAAIHNQRVARATPIEYLRDAKLGSEATVEDESVVTLLPAPEMTAIANNRILRHIKRQKEAQQQFSSAKSTLLQILKNAVENTHTFPPKGTYTIDQHLLAEDKYSFTLEGSPYYSELTKEDIGDLPDGYSIKLIYLHSFHDINQPYQAGNDTQYWAISIVARVDGEDHEVFHGLLYSKFLQQGGVCMGGCNYSISDNRLITGKFKLHNHWSWDFSDNVWERTTADRSFADILHDRCQSVPSDAFGRLFYLLGSGIPVFRNGELQPGKTAVYQDDYFASFPMDTDPYEFTKLSSTTPKDYYAQDMVNRLLPDCYDMTDVITCLEGLIS